MGKVVHSDLLELLSEETLENIERDLRTALEDGFEWAIDLPASDVTGLLSQVEKALRVLR